MKRKEKLFNCSKLSTMASQVPEPTIKRNPRNLKSKTGEVKMSGKLDTK